jgi:hypothetical protein
MTAEYKGSDVIEQKQATIQTAQQVWVLCYARSSSEQEWRQLVWGHIWRQQQLSAFERLLQGVRGHIRHCPDVYLLGKFQGLPTAGAVHLALCGCDAHDCDVNDVGVDQQQVQPCLLKHNPLHAERGQQGAAGEKLC